MEYTNLKLEKENLVATVRLNRPEALTLNNHSVVIGRRHFVC